MKTKEQFDKDLENKVLKAALSTIEKNLKGTKLDNLTCETTVFPFFAGAGYDKIIYSNELGIFTEVQYYVGLGAASFPLFGAAFYDEIETRTINISHLKLTL